jgi:hypothetical protein
MIYNSPLLTVLFHGGLALSVFIAVYVKTNSLWAAIVVSLLDFGFFIGATIYENSRR